MLALKRSGIHTNILVPFTFNPYIINVIGYSVYCVVINFLHVKSFTKKKMEMCVFSFLLMNFLEQKDL